MSFDLLQVLSPLTDGGTNCCVSVDKVGLDSLV